MLLTYVVFSLFFFRSRRRYLNLQYIDIYLYDSTLRQKKNATPIFQKKGIKFKTNWTAGFAKIKKPKIEENLFIETYNFFKGGPCNFFSMKIRLLFFSKNQEISLKQMWKAVNVRDTVGMFFHLLFFSTEFLIARLKHHGPSSKKV